MGEAAIQNVNNVFVCCAAAAADEAYAGAAAVVEALGESALLWPGCWYLQTSLSATEVRAKISPVVDESRALMVVDATNREAAWRNIGPEAAELIRESWHNGSLGASRQRMPLPEIPRDKSGAG